MTSIVTAITARILKMVLSREWKPCPACGGAKVLHHMMTETSVTNSLISPTVTLPAPRECHWCDGKGHRWFHLQFGDLCLDQSKKALTTLIYMGQGPETDGKHPERHWFITNWGDIWHTDQDHVVFDRIRLLNREREE